MGVETRNDEGEKELVAVHRVKKSGGGAATIAQAEIREQRLRNALQT